MGAKIYEQELDNDKRKLYLTILVSNRWLGTVFDLLGSTSSIVSINNPFEPSFCKPARGPVTALAIGVTDGIFSKT